MKIRPVGTAMLLLVLLASLSSPARVAAAPLAAPVAGTISPQDVRNKIAGNWKILKGKLRERWGKLTKDDIAIAKGRAEILSGRIQARYGINKEEADRQIAEWLTQQK
jgi:uncharacterized protein YjbJ (UPF0337 family)